MKKPVVMCVKNQVFRVCETRSPNVFVKHHVPQGSFLEGHSPKNLQGVERVNKLAPGKCFCKAREDRKKISCLLLAILSNRLDLLNLTRQTANIKYHEAEV